MTYTPNTRSFSQPDTAPFVPVGPLSAREEIPDTVLRRIANGSPNWDQGTLTEEEQANFAPSMQGIAGELLSRRAADPLDEALHTGDVLFAQLAHFVLYLDTLSLGERLRDVQWRCVNTGGFWQDPELTAGASHIFTIDLYCVTGSGTNATEALACWMDAARRIATSTFTQSNGDSGMPAVAI